jgi:PQQ-like domain
MNTDVTTRSFNFARTGANTNETVLTPAAISANGIKTLLTFNTDDPRVEAQPLYLSGLNIGGKTRNVIYQATMGNTIYAWDADTGQQLWSTNLGMPINGSTDIDAHNINVKWGILSTPVIDRAAGTLYACAWISTDKTGKWQTGQYFVAAVDIVTGALKAGKPLLNLEGVTFQSGHGLAAIQFRSIERKQRSALALTNGAVIICFGTIAETAKSARGWMIAIDTTKWQIAACWCSTARGSGGGIWMSASGPAIQSDGSIWVVTGNGDFDGETDFSESVVRLKYTPASGNTGASIQVSGWWTPWTDDGRTGGNPEGEDGTAMQMLSKSKLPRASNFRAVPYLARMGVQAMDMGSAWGDQDVGASGIVLVEALGIGLVSCKDGILYTVNLNNPGDTAPANLAINTAPANYAKLAAPPILYTYYDDAMNPATPNPATLNWLSGNVTHHLHGTPVFWLSAAHGSMHFCGGENGNLRAWTINANKSSTYLACSAAYASTNSPVPPGGMPGWSISLSANGNSNGIVWAMIPYGDANMQLTNSRLLAYDAQNLAQYQGGAGEIAPLWDSQAWNWNFLHPKFNRPVAVAGKIIVPTYDGRLMVLGLA